MKKRTSTINRSTKETTISLTLDLDGTGEAAVKTGIGFLDHMLISLSRHSGIDLTLECQGDLEVDDHHTAEDCAIVLGAALDEALGDRSGIQRFGYAYAPLDEALARAAVDLSGRPTAEISLQLEGERVGALACENVSHVMRSLAMTSKSTIHVDVLKGANDHHRAEAAFKALALALKQAVAPSGNNNIPSTKGVL
jgi:imidazoleglycerol phosphate dehydratase HisB